MTGRLIHGPGQQHAGLPRFRRQLKTPADRERNIFRCGCHDEGHRATSGGLHNAIKPLLGGKGIKINPFCRARINTTPGCL